MRSATLVPATLMLLSCQETIGGAVPPALHPVAAGPAASAPAPAPSIAPEPDLAARVEELELEVAQLKLTIEQMQLAGIGSMDAVHVTYQPNRTTMAARDVQAALDELWVGLHGTQEAAVDMGAPGEGLFDLENGPLGPRHGGGEKKEPPAGQPGMAPPPGGGQGMKPPPPPQGR